MYFSKQSECWPVGVIFLQLLLVLIQILTNYISSVVWFISFNHFWTMNVYGSSSPKFYIFCCCLYFSVLDIPKKFSIFYLAFNRESFSKFLFRFNFTTPNKFWYPTNQIVYNPHSTQFFDTYCKLETIVYAWMCVCMV